MRRIGKYVLEEEFPSGGMGRVFRARHRHDSFPQHYAIKFLRRDARKRPDLVQRFEQEAKVLAMLSHPNIVKVFDYDVSFVQGPYIVMELLDGQNLDKRIKESPLTEDDAAAFAITVLDALQVVHQSGYVHRDVKSSNIQVCSDGRAVLMDFGIAKGPSMTQAQSILGTPDVASPEQNWGGAVDRRSDLYSVGVLLYEMIAGYRPFPGDDPYSVRVAQESSPPPDLLQASAQMQVIVVKALANDPNHRFQTAEEMKRALLALTGGSPATPVQRPPGTVTTEFNTPTFSGTQHATVDTSPDFSAGRAPAAAATPAMTGQYVDTGPAVPREERRAGSRDEDLRLAKSITVAAVIVAVLLFLALTVLFRRLFQ